MVIGDYTGPDCQCPKDGVEAELHGYWECYMSSKNRFSVGDSKGVCNFP